jgi:hypothetical protein
MDNISSMTIQSTSIQFLETLDILDNSKNIETIQSRIEFLESVTEKLIYLKDKLDYQFLIQLAVDHYNLICYNRSPSETNLSRLSSPDNFDLETYCINALINGLKRFFDEQLDEIEFLKSSSSKEKRISKVTHNILLVKNYLQIKFSESKSYESGIEEIDKMVTKIKLIHKTILS